MICFQNNTRSGIVNTCMLLRKWDLLLSITVSDWPADWALFWIDLRRLICDILQWEEEKPIFFHTDARFLKSPPSWIHLFHQKASVCVSLWWPFSLYFVFPLSWKWFILSQQTALFETHFSQFTRFKKRLNLHHPHHQHINHLKPFFCRNFRIIFEILCGHDHVLLLDTYLHIR